MKSTLSLFILFVSFVGYAQEKVIKLEKGNVLSLVAAHYHSREAQQQASAYFDEVFPLAQKHTFKPLVTFNTIELKQRHFMAGGFGLYSWNSKKDIDAFRKEEKWPELKASRPQYWKNLRSVKVNIQQDMELRFSADKVYRITYVWLHDFDNAADNLDKYVAPMRAVITRLGGKYIMSFDSSSIIGIDALNNDRTPDRVAITEWPDTETHDQYISSREFQANKKYFFASVAEFEAFDVKANIE